MYYDNKNYEAIWADLDDSSPYKILMEKILEYLPQKDLKFIQAYYYLGISEEDITPMLGYSSQASVSDFKKRVFARIKMYAHKELIFLPLCVAVKLKSDNKALHDTLKIMLNPFSVNRIAEDRTYKSLFQDLIKRLIDYLQETYTSCNQDCPYVSKCKKLCKKDDLIAKIINIKEYSPQTNLLFLIKFLEYLLNWRVFDATN